MVRILQNGGNGYGECILEDQRVEEEAYRLSLIYWRFNLKTLVDSMVAPKNIARQQWMVTCRMFLQSDYLAR